MTKACRLFQLSVWVFLFRPIPIRGQAPEQPCSIECLAPRARNALAAHHYPEYLAYARQIVERAPDHPRAAYGLARAYALAGDSAGALRQLHRLAELGGIGDPASDSAFADLYSIPGFQSVAKQIAGNRTPIVRGKLAFTLPDPDLLPEALAYDPDSGRWLLGSLAKRKVTQLTSDSSTTDFITDPRLLRVVGIHVDRARGVLWFATWAPRPTGPTPDPDPPSDTRLFKCDLATGRILRMYAPADPEGSHLFNDLTIASNGDVFVTDTEQGWIYRVRADRDSLEVFLRPDPSRFTSANGISLSGDNRTLYVGYMEGVARIDLHTGSVARLTAAARGSTAAVDGLYWYQGSLLAVQHSPGVEQVARFELAKDGRSIQQIHILERGATIMHLPTTGAVVGDRFYYIATSQYDRLGGDNELQPAREVPAPRSTVRVIDLRSAFRRHPLQVQPVRPGPRDTR